ncbi:MAG TPA: hypothetical protein VKR79_05925 [Gaiellaceae bacterium]|nr:hypothetical protein [Gaiellaceae bacterium]
MAKYSFASLFGFLSSRRKKDELIAEYVIREHHRGRALDEILRDPHVVNNYSPDDLRQLLDSPALIHAVGEDVIAAQRSQV